MDEVGLRVVYIFTDLILPLVIGYWLKKKNKLTAEQCNWLIRFGIIVIFTILSLLSFWVLPLRMDLILLPVYGLLCALIPMAIVYGLGRYKKFADLSEQGSYIITAIPSNVGTMGGLCAFILYGEIGFAYAQMVGVFQNLVMFFICFPLGYYFKFRSQNGGKLSFLSLDWRHVFLNWNQISVVAMGVGILLYVMDVPRPDVLAPIFTALIHIGAWFALLPIGYLIDFSGIKQYYMPTLDLIPIKMIITPAILYFIGTLFTSDPILLGSILIFMATPCAINALITIRLYGLNVDLSMAPFISTIAVYILVLFPLFYYLVNVGILPFK